MEKKKFIKCPACKERSFINIKKEFSGFKVVTEKKTCALCGYEFKPDEEPEYIEEKPLFKDEGEEKKLCRDCQYYVVHPWTQKCTLHKKEVTALDSCPDFLQKED